MNVAVLHPEGLLSVRAEFPRLSAQALRFFLYCAQATSDAVTIGGSYLLADMVYHGSLTPSVDLFVAGMVVPLFLLFALYGRAYGHDVLLSPGMSVARAVNTLVVAVAATLLAAFAVKGTGELSRWIFLAGTGTAVFGLAAQRFCFSTLVGRAAGSRIMCNVLILDGLEVTPPDDFQILDARQLGIRPSLQDPMTLHLLGELLAGADRVVVASKAERRAAWAAVLKGSNLSAEIIAPEMGELQPIQTNSLSGLPTVVVSCGPLDLRNRIIKRVFDLAVTVPVVVLLTPLLLVAALAIRLESPGPIFFTQMRMGRGNRLFKVYKFRSMHTHLCDHDGVESASRGDARLTKVGRIIRATSIDELPQLLNVVLGDMSLVGPRPHALGSLAGERLFWEVDSRYWHRHASKPGITGLAQIRGFRGATHEQADLTNRLKADLEYLSDWSIWRDLGILLATFRVLRHENAF